MRRNPRPSGRLGITCSATLLLVAALAGSAWAANKVVSTSGTGSSTAAALTTSSTATTTTTQAQPVVTPDPPGPSQSTSAVIDGAVGGQVTQGRFTLTVPAGAWYGRATVTLTVPKPNVLACELAISPAALNGFSAPVTLAAKTNGLDHKQPYVFGWLDPATSQWMPVPGSVDDPTDQVTTVPLYHFSCYGVFAGGRAGW